MQRWDCDARAYLWLAITVLMSVSVATAQTGRVASVNPADVRYPEPIRGPDGQWPRPFPHQQGCRDDEVWAGTFCVRTPRWTWQSVMEGRAAKSRDRRAMRHDPYGAVASIRGIRDLGRPSRMFALRCRSRWRADPDGTPLETPVRLVKGQCPAETFCHANDDLPPEIDAIDAVADSSRGSASDSATAEAFMASEARVPRRVRPIPTINCIRAVPPRGRGPGVKPRKKAAPKSTPPLTKLDDAESSTTNRQKNRTPASSPPSGALTEYLHWVEQQMFDDADAAGEDATAESSARAELENDLAQLGWPATAIDQP